MIYIYLIKFSIPTRTGKKVDLIIYVVFLITRHTEYKDPETDKKVPVDIRYTTSYSDSGISCTERSDVGGKVSERSLWTLEYDNPESYSTNNI